MWNVWNWLYNNSGKICLVATGVAVAAVAAPVVFVVSAGAATVSTGIAVTSGVLSLMSGASYATKVNAQQPSTKVIPKVVEARDKVDKTEDLRNQKLSMQLESVNVAAQKSKLKHKEAAAALAAKKEENAALNLKITQLTTEKEDEALKAKTAELEKQKIQDDLDLKKKEYVIAQQNINIRDKQLKISKLQNEQAIKKYEKLKSQFEELKEEFEKYEADTCDGPQASSKPAITSSFFN